MRIWHRLSSKFRFILNRIRERLWVRPLVMGLVSILAAYLASVADRFDIAQTVPTISSDTIETLLRISASSMLVIATFAVGAMLSAYSSAARGATPRAFTLVLADDVSQNALSSFIGAFIFSIIALVALMNGYYEEAGRFVLFLLTITVFIIVIFNFVRWVDKIARLGRLATTIDKVEKAAEQALVSRRDSPTLGGSRASGEPRGHAVHAGEIGYVRHIDVASLQSLAEEQGMQIRVAALPGALASPCKPLAYVDVQPGDEDCAAIVKAFVIGGDRTYDEDPRFGLIVLAEIASRALSPAVNDPGTAIDIIGTLVRLFTIWTDEEGKPKDKDQNEEEGEDGGEEVKFDHVEIPQLAVGDMFDDAFNAIARDGAGMFEVCMRLQKALCDLYAIGDEEMREAARTHSERALKYARQSAQLPEDIEALEAVADW